MYSTKARHVIARFVITVNQRLDGLEEFLDKKSTMTEFGALADIAQEDDVKLAGSKKRDRSQRAFGGTYSFYFAFFQTKFEQTVKQYHYKAVFRCDQMHCNNYQSYWHRVCPGYY